MNHRKIAFIHYPHAANSARLETMPFALNIVLNLARLGWNVDLYLWEEASNKYENLLPSNVQILYFHDPKPGRINMFRPIWQKIRFSWRKDYALVFGLGQIGIHIAHAIAKSSSCHFIYVNDEFPSCWGKTYWSKHEAQVASLASMIVVPDKQRFEPLCAEINIAHRPYVELPNIPERPSNLESIDWYSRLGILPEQQIFLHAGSVADWAQIPEILCTVPHWDKSAVLLIHSRSKDGMESYRRQLSHLDIPGRVVWSDEPLTEKEINSLVAFCQGSFALYRNTGPNIEYMGTSSGKLMRSVACGTPIIASRFDSLSFVRQHNIGLLVSHSAEIPAAVDTILNNQETYRQNCIDFYQTLASFDRAWPQFCEQLELNTGIRL
jgi:glycosyltransferase involved in cell wall biosynthesis